MKIVVDAFGGDNAPLEIVKGAALAEKELGVDIILTGNTEIINKCIADNGIVFKGGNGHITEHHINGRLCKPIPKGLLYRFPNIGKIVKIRHNVLLFCTGKVRKSKGKK